MDAITGSCAVIKGDRPEGEIIPAEAIQLDFVAPPTATLLLVRDDAWSMWVGVGAVTVEHASWLRQIAGGKRSSDMNADEWQARVALMLPYLEHQEPLVAKIAYGELAAAPYAALQTAKPRLAASAIRRWLADPELSARRPLFFLLLGIAGDARDAAALEEQLEASWTARDATNLGSMIAADLQLRGPSRMAWVDAKYMGDRQRSTRELEAALLALSVLGNANDAIPRERVIQSYRMFIREHQELAGFVAWDLAAWHYWERGALIPRAAQIECPATFRIASRDLRLFATKPGRQHDRFGRVEDWRSRSDKRGTFRHSNVAAMTFTNHIDFFCHETPFARAAHPFLDAGAILFGAYAYVERKHGGAEQSKQIQLTIGDISQLVQVFRSQWRRDPTPEELRQLVEDKAREEILYREALALGLDKDDTIVKRRMAQKMQFLAGRRRRRARAYSRGARDMVRSEPRPVRISAARKFPPSLFSPDRRQAGARDDAAAALTKLAGQPEDSNLAATLADAFMFQDYYRDRTPEFLGKEFGPNFALTVTKLSPGSWQGPVESGFGWHLVFVDTLISGRVPAFEEVEADVKKAWLAEQKALAWQKAYQDLRAKCIVFCPRRLTMHRQAAKRRKVSRFPSRRERAPREALEARHRVAACRPAARPAARAACGDGARVAPSVSRYQ